MIWTALAAAGGLLKRIPWPVWAIAAVLLTGLLWGNHRYSQGVADERDAWEQKIEDGKLAAVKTDTAADVRKAGQAATIATDSNARKEAIANAPADQTDAPGRALACQRLRQARVDPLPAACQ